MSLREGLKFVCKRCVQIAYGAFSEITMPVFYAWSHTSGELAYLSHDDLTVWKNAMRGALREHLVSGYSSRLNELIPTFASAKVKVIRKENTFSPEIPIVVLCVKNDRRRIKMLVKHYRRYGVNQFAFLDNGSTDGTLEWLLAQPDIDIFHTDMRYSSFRKEAWINRVISHYGFERWFILTDSDELIVYEGMETHPFSSVIEFLKVRGMKRVKGLTLDMYSDAGIFLGDTPDDGIQNKYCWMDRDSYLEEERKIGNSMLSVFTGGPRMRLMGVKTSLSKYPLVYFTKGTVSENAHFQYPYAEAENTVCHFGILHYKFLEEDKAMYKIRSNRSSGFARGGGDYKRYMELAQDDAQASFMYEGSIRYQNSFSLEGIALIKRIPFD